MKKGLNILYEDNHLIVVEKEAGVLTQGGSLKLPVLLDEVKEHIKIKYNKPGRVFLGMVHRLDTNVGGVIVFAKTSKGASRISKEIREKRLNKRYLAVVEGKVNTNEEVKLVDYIIKDERNKKAIITNSNKGKESILKFKKLAEDNNLTLVEIKLITGRFHQIRAQLSNYGIPIYGDIKYGSVNKNEELGLYAYYLSFAHPTKKEEIIIKHFPQNKLFFPLLKKAKLV